MGHIYAQSPIYIYTYILVLNSPRSGGEIFFFFNRHFAIRVTRLKKKTRIDHISGNPSILRCRNSTFRVYSFVRFYRYLSNIKIILLPPITVERTQTLRVIRDAPCPRNFIHVWKGNRVNRATCRRHNEYHAREFSKCLTLYTFINNRFEIRIIT